MSADLLGHMFPVGVGIDPRTLRRHTLKAGAAPADRAAIEASGTASGMVSARGAMEPQSVVATRRTMASLVTGRTRMVRTTSTLFERSASDWISALPTSCSSAGAPPSGHFVSNART